jgi:hypothetical protein
MAKKNTLDGFFATLLALSILPVIVIYVFLYSDTGNLFMFGIQNPEVAGFLDGNGIDAAWRIVGLGTALLVLNFGSVIMLLVASLYELEQGCQALQRKWLPVAGLIVVAIEVLAYLFKQFTSG